LFPREEEPDDAQIEVAITAMGAAIAADAGEEYVSLFPPREMEGESVIPVEPISE